MHCPFLYPQRLACSEGSFAHAVQAEDDAAVALLEGSAAGACAAQRVIELEQRLSDAQRVRINAPLHQHACPFEGQVVVSASFVGTEELSGCLNLCGMTSLSSLGDPEGRRGLLSTSGSFAVAQRVRS